MNPKHTVANLAALSVLVEAFDFNFENDALSKNTYNAISTLILIHMGQDAKDIFTRAVFEASDGHFYCENSNDLWNKMYEAMIAQKE